MAGPGRVELAILGQTLTVRTEASPEHLRDLAAYLEERVAEVRRVFTGPGKRVIYLAEITYRGDYVHLEMDLKG